MDFPAWVGDAVLGGDGSAAAVDQLVTAQLLEDGRGLEDAAGQRRFRFHDLLRAYAREQLDAAEPVTAQREALRRVLDGYLARARAAAYRLRPLGVPPAETCVDGFAWFRAEQRAVVSAVEEAAEAGWADLAGRLAVSLEGFFERRTAWDPWQHTAEVALAAARVAGNRATEAEALRSLGYLARERGRAGQARELLEESLALFRAGGDRLGEAQALSNLIRVNRDLARFADAQRCHDEAAPLATAPEHHWLAATIEREIGMVLRDRGRGAEALPRLESALALFQATGDDWLATYTRHDIGLVHVREGRSAEAVPLAEVALAGLERLGDRRGVARAAHTLGTAHLARGELDAAEAYFTRALAAFEEIGDQRWTAYTRRARGELHRDQALALRNGGRSRTSAEREHWRAAEAELTESRRLLDALGDRPWEARTLLRLGEVYLYQDRRAESIGCLDRCLAEFRRTDDAENLATATALREQATARE